MYKGIAGSEGIGIGKVVIIEDHDITIETKHVPKQTQRLPDYRRQLKSLWKLQIRWLIKWMKLLVKRTQTF